MKAGFDNVSKQIGTNSEENRKDMKDIQESIQNLGSTWRQELATFKEEMGNGFEAIDRRTEAQGRDIADMQERVVETEEWNADLKGILAASFKHQRRLQEKVTDLEGRSRRNNIRVWGVPEGAEKDSASEFIELLIHEELKLGEDASLQIHLKKTYLSKLSSKYAEKPWTETFQLVHRCMEKARSDSKHCEPIMRCLQILQEAQNVTSLSAMVTRLEMIAKQRGLGSHLSPTETACYLTADPFYVEVLLLPGGEVEDVKVAQHGEAPESNAALCELLRMKKFKEFSLRMDDLASLYNLPGDGGPKLKVYTSLQHMQKDLVKISNLPRHSIESDVYIDMVLNGRIGRITPSREGSPMSVEYYISPSDALMDRLHPGQGNWSQTAVVVVGASATTHRLQMESLIPTQPQLDSLGLPAFIPLSETCSEFLPAFFLLKLKPPVPMLSSFIHKMSQITGVLKDANSDREQSSLDIPPDADLQGEPLFQLLQSIALEDKRPSDGKDVHFLVSLPDAEFHSYLFDDAEWKCDLWKGSLIHTVPFTHPAHVPALLDVLRYQSAINTLLLSCITSLQHQPGLVCELSGEILPESDCSFSVTFSFLDSETLAVLLVSVTDCRQVRCRLLMPGAVDPSLDDYISRVLTRCMSIPITLRAIRKRISSLRPPALPLKPDSARNAESSSSTPAHCAAEITPAVLPSAVLSPKPMEEDDLPSNPGHSDNSVVAAPAADGANTDAIANRSLCLSECFIHAGWPAASQLS
ncbi:mediator of RNA polymerase II transcription subunit 1-like [Neoarius graeffei]|uniref:mediator of RNA polymerase II transcription subunit 1-like n=1 Tax=Neoarius graeffei TaxID=443677 RepID=UPI00298C4EC1|nr:mediator of RNA polymerase II transcription subunit 1-like [Neoarius graeffei]